MHDHPARCARRNAGGQVRKKHREPLQQKFRITLVIEGQSASQAKRQADEGENEWVLNEITDNDDVIGILFKASFDKKYEKIGVRHGYLFLHPDQFDKLIGNLTTGTKIRFYTRQDVQSECDLIGKVEVTTRKIEPQS